MLITFGSFCLNDFKSVAPIRLEIILRFLQYQNLPILRILYYFLNWNMSGSIGATKTS